MKKCILILILSLVALLNVKAADDWLVEENRLVKEYLLSLHEQDIGKTLDGVLLPYNQNPIKGSTYLGKVLDKKEGLVIYMFQNPKIKHSFLWKETEGKYPLPICEQLIGAGSFVLSGDVYTNKYLSKEDGIVQNVCQDAAWYR